MSDEKERIYSTGNLIINYDLSVLNKIVQIANEACERIKSTREVSRKLFRIRSYNIILPLFI